MKKFTFRLQKVLGLRHMQERDKLGKLGREQQTLEAEIVKLELFCRESDEHISAIKTEKEQPFRVWSESVNQNYLLRIRRVVEFQGTQVSRQEHAVSSARSSYIEARRDTKVVERLREKRREDWMREVSMEEGKALDEAAARVHMGDKI
jgi:flagellar FliJ protein